jgi:hypothetical protein
LFLLFVFPFLFHLHLFFRLGGGRLFDGLSFGVFLEKRILGQLLIEHLGELEGRHVQEFDRLL